MEVKGKSCVAIEIDNKELARALKQTVYTEFTLPLHHEVHHDGSTFIETIKAHTTHSFEYDKPIRPADEEEIEVFEAFHVLKEFLDTV